MRAVLIGSLPMSFAWFIRDRAVQWTLASVAVACMVGAVTFALVRLQAVSDLQTENVRLRAAVTELQRRLDVQLVADQQRWALIEQTVFGTVVPEIAADQAKKKPVMVLSGPAQWQVNRDRELQNRLAVLEKWRIQHEDQER